MDEETEAALMRAGQRIDLLQLQVKALRADRDSAHARLDRAVELLAGVRSLLYPAPVTVADGRMMVSRPKNQDSHATLQELSDRIRALPDELDALMHAPLATR